MVVVYLIVNIKLILLNETGMSVKYNIFCVSCGSVEIIFGVKFNIYRKNILLGLFWNKQQLHFLLQKVPVLKFTFFKDL